ncbi:hypothetical protein RDWZM_009979, partial [Blomia tropicalis]
MHIPIFTRSLLVVMILVTPFVFGEVNGFFLEKLERIKKFAFPNLGSAFGFTFPGLSNGVRVCINFNSNLNYPQGYQQNTCFICDSYRFNQI